MNTPARTSRPSRSNRRRGIALIFVLGCLAMIVIAAISFASFMKVERLVAGQSLELTRARQAAMAGLERVLDRLNRGVGSPDFVYDSAAGATNYWPRTEVFFRTGGDSRFRFPSGALGFDGTMTYLGSNQLAGLPANLQPDFFTGDLLPGEPRTTGAAVSVIANVSGRIDIGVLSAAPSPSRNQPGGVDASALLTAIGGPTQTQIATNSRRDTMLDYYSMPEVRYIGGVGTKLTSGRDIYFSFLEQACQQYRSTAGVTNAVYIGPLLPVGITANPAFRVSLLDALLSAGVPAATGVQASFNVADYLDPDFVPSGTPNDFCGEPIPLLNELNLRATQTTTSSNIVSKITLRAEFNFPFARNATMTNPATGANDTRYKIRVTHLASTGGTVSLPSTDIAVDPAATYWTYSNTADEYKVVTVLNDVEVRSPAGTANVRVQMAFDVLGAGNVVVDRVGTAAAPIEFAAIIDGYNFSREVLDGRFNFTPSQWTTFIPTGTLGAMNSSMTTRPEALAEYPYFVRNNPMQSVCELGHIGLGDRAWQSFALVEDTTLPTVGHPLVHRVLDTFTVHLGQEFDGRPVSAATLIARSGRAGPLVRGLINMNTDTPDVLATAMMNGKVGERYPLDTSGIATLDWNGAKALATLVVNARKAYPAPRNSFMRKSDVGEINRTAGSPFWLFPGSGNWTESQKEGVLRQFMDLSDVRGNTFVVLVRGYAVVDNGTAYGPPLAANDVLTSSVELVAHVWRDPQTRRTQIRNLKWADRDDDSIPNL